MSFLKAEWRKLAFANYSIDPEILKKHLPYGTELDFWDSKCYVSLIGFLFVNTKLLGVRIPFHINFEEVNLRFYVKRRENGQWKRGVVFIKEIVPKPAITFVANTIYKENYETLPMRHEWLEKEDSRLIKYEWKKKNRWHSFEVITELNSSAILPDSETEFITEHYWGYAKANSLVTNEYEVIHQRWEHYQVLQTKIDVDFEAIYGSEFEFLSKQKPASVMLAEGSVITIEGKKVIK